MRQNFFLSLTVLCLSVYAEASFTIVESRSLVDSGNQSIISTVSIVSTAAAKNKTVNLEIRDASDVRVFQKVFLAQNFKAQIPITFSWSQPISTARIANGNYNLLVALFDAGWVNAQLWVPKAVSFTVKLDFGSQSQSGATIPGVSSLTDSKNLIWTLTPNRTVLVNGLAAGYTADVVMVLYYDGTIYQKNAAQNWWAWINGSWSSVIGDPRNTTSSLPISFPTPSPGPVPIVSSTKPMRGLQIEGFEYPMTANDTLGVNYTNNEEQLFAYISGKGLGLVRLPILWERIQPTLNGPLAPTQLALLKQSVAWAKKYNLKVVLDLHNYGRYNSQIIDSSGGYVTRIHMQDVWLKLSNEFKNETAIYGYDLMNEPHDMGGTDFGAVQQSVVDRIRANGDSQTIIIEGWRGSNYSASFAWATDQSATPWIQDSLGKIIYSAHSYFDREAAGWYRMTYAQELALNPNLENIGVERLRPFGEWCVRNKVKCYLGEFGVPGNEKYRRSDSGGPDLDPRWNVVLEKLYQALDFYGMDATYFAAGIWLNDAVSVQPYDNYSRDTQQMSVILKYK